MERQLHHGKNELGKMVLLGFLIDFLIDFFIDFLIDFFIDIFIDFDDQKA